MQFHGKLNDAKTIATITIDGKDHKVAAPEVDEIMKQLGTLRGEMTPAFPMQPVMGEKITLSLGPVWFVHNDPVLGGTLVQLRDNCLGWSNVVLPPEQVDGFCNALRATTEKAIAQRVPEQDKTLPQAANG